MIITMSSLKGGVGKSTLSIFLANCLAAMGKKVLFIDLDPNNSGTMYYTTGIENIESIIQKCNAFEMLSHNSIEDYAVKTRKENIDIIPSSLNLFKLRSIGYTELKKTLQNNTYDFVIIDTAPNYDNIVINAYKASDYILTPISFDPFNFSTTSFLQKQLYDEIPEQADKWFLFYAHWEAQLAQFPNSMQMQFVSYFESNFSNILDIHFPECSAAHKYIAIDMKIKETTKVINERRIWEEINKLACMFTGEEKYAQEF